MIRAIILILILFSSLIPQAEAVAADHLVINELRVSGETATDEYLKLYNPTDLEIPLAGFRLSKITLSGSRYNLITTFPDVKVASKSFFTISHKDFKGERDFEYTSSSYSLADDNAVVLYSDAGKTEVDKVAYGKNLFGEGQPAIAPAKDDPIKRKVDGEDSNDNSVDFVLNSSLVLPPPPVPGEEPPVTPEPEEEEPEEETPNSSSILGVYINEIMPNPKSPEKDSNDEWFELFNSSTVRIDLSGAIIRDGVGRVREYAFPIGTFIESGEYLVFYSADTRISLSNSGDFLELLDSSRNPIDKTLNYGKAKDDFSFSLFEDGWDWTKNITSEAENSFESIEEEKKTINSNQKAKRTKVKAPPKEKKVKTKLEKAKKVGKPKYKKESTKKVKGAQAVKKDNEIAGVSGKIESDKELFNWDNRTKGKILIFLGIALGINYLLFREKFYEIFKQKFYGDI